MIKFDRDRLIHRGKYRLREDWVRKLLSSDDLVLSGLSSEDWVKRDLGILSHCRILSRDMRVLINWCRGI